MQAIYGSSETGGLKLKISLPERELFGNSVCEGSTYALGTASQRFKLLKQQFCKCHSLGERAGEISSLFKTNSAHLSRMNISISPKNCSRKNKKCNSSQFVIQ